MRILHRTVLVLIASAVLAPAAGAQSTVTVANNSFETPDLGSSSFTNDDIPGWNWSGGGPTPSGFAFGVFNPNSTAAFSVPVPDGKQTAYINNGVIYQDTVTMTAGATYTLSGYIGQRNDVAGSGSLNLYTSDGTFLAGTGSKLPTAGTFGLYSVSYAAGPAAAGKTLRILLSDDTAGQVNFDKIGLSATAVPEPSGLASLTLFGVSLACLLLRNRRRTAA